VFDNRTDETRDVQMLSSADSNHSFSDVAERLALAETCPKFSRCSAPLCPALGGKHLDSERVCHYLRESVKPGGQTRIRAVLPTALADTVATEGLRLLTSTGGLQIALQRASKSGSRMELMKQALSKGGSGHD
jgi:hypothetical protein